jgi:PPOX class probable F420-dependent enzyme
MGIRLGMPKPPLPQELGDFLSRPNPSVIASLMPDGSPHTAATWYIWDGGRVLVNMDETRKRLQYIRNDPRVSITILGENEWYRQITLRGRAATIAPDDGLTDIDRLSRHYTGEPYANRESPRVSAWIDVESWYGWIGGRFWTG